MYTYPLSRRFPLVSLSRMTLSLFRMARKIASRFATTSFPTMLPILPSLSFGQFSRRSAYLPLPSLYPDTSLYIAPQDKSVYFFYPPFGTRTPSLPFSNTFSFRTNSTFLWNFVCTPTCYLRSSIRFLSNGSFLPFRTSPYFGLLLGRPPNALFGSPLFSEDLLSVSLFRTPLLLETHLFL